MPPHRGRETLCRAVLARSEIDHVIDLISRD